ncbi:MAG: Flp pilus assembly protein CpaB [Alphaproteobacteria bacterium]|nr:MAG: Flp pilus assembly protein CpaB [Alphaproteobacteria bacterium]
MNRQVLIILGGGLCVALLIALLLQSMLGAPEPTQQIAKIPATYILIATKNIKMGDALSEKSYEWKEWPKDAIFEGAIVKSKLSEEELKTPLSGRVRRSISKGEPLVQSAMVKEDKGNFVAATLAPGMRAMAIKVKAESSVGGFLMPNDRVDVILTYDVRIPSDERVQDASVNVISKKAAQTVLENLRVVAVDQKAKEVEKVSVARTVTLEVTPKQAEELALAEAMGKLSLSLRKLGDDKPLSEDGKIPQATTDVRMSNVMQELLGNENSSGVQSRVVRIYNGATSSDVVVRPTPAQ